MYSPGKEWPKSEEPGAPYASHPLGKDEPKSQENAPYVLPAPYLDLRCPPTPPTTSVLPTRGRWRNGNANWKKLECSCEGHDNFDDHADHNDHNDHNDHDNHDTGTCDALEATRKAYKRV